MEEKTKHFIICAAVIAGSLAAFAPTSGFAASLLFSPTSGSHAVGHSFTVAIQASSADKAMNAAQGTVSFPIDKLQVVGLSTADSIVNLWVQQPSYSNHDGVINFEGVVTNPGFQGAAGTILEVTFMARAPGSVALSFSSGDVLANDGKGTNITDGLGSATFTVIPQPPTPAPTTTASGSVAVPSGIPATLPLITPPPGGQFPPPAPPNEVECVFTHNIFDLWQCGVTGRIAVFGLEWGAFIVFLVLMGALATIVVYAIIHRVQLWKIRNDKEIIAIRTALREDLRRIEDHLEEDMTPDRMAHAERIRKTIETIERDLAEDIRRIDFIEKENDPPSSAGPLPPGSS